jgi:hypothetical protein
VNALGLSEAHEKSDSPATLKVANEPLTVTPLSSNEVFPTPENLN